MAINTAGLTEGRIQATLTNVTGAPMAFPEHIRGGGIGNYTTAERNAIDERILDHNMLIYNSTTAQFEVFHAASGATRGADGNLTRTGGTWVAFGSPAPSGGGSGGSLGANSVGLSQIHADGDAALKYLRIDSAGTGLEWEYANVGQTAVFTTLALRNAATTDWSTGDLARVSSDATATNNGLYAYIGTSPDSVDGSANADWRKLVDDVTFGSDFVTTGDVISLADNSVDTAELVDAAVTTAKIGDDQVTLAKMADDSVGGEQLRVANNGSVGQVLTSDGDGTFTWHTISASFVPSIGAAIGITGDDAASASVNALEVDTSATPADQTLTGTFTVGSGYLFTGTGDSKGAAGTETLTVTGRTDAGATIAASNLTVTKTNLTDSTFTLVVGGAAMAQPGTITITATVFAAAGGAPSSEVVTTTIRIERGWYRHLVVSSNVPANLSVMADQGVWLGTASTTFAGIFRASNPQSAYVALPTRSGGYRFMSNVYVLDSNVVTPAGFDTGWTLYELPDAGETTITGEGGNLTVTITEA